MIAAGNHCYGKLREGQGDISGAEVLMNDQMLEEHVDITREAIEKLIRIHDSDMALVYIYYCQTGLSDVESISRGILMPRQRTSEALERLELAGLIGDGSEDRGETDNRVKKSGPTPEETKNRKMYDEMFAALVREAELVMQHQASVPDLQKLLEIYQNYELAPEALMILLHYVADRYNERYAGTRSPSMSAIDREAKLWRSNGVRDMDSAEKYIVELQNRKALETDIKEAIGIIGRDLTDSERQFIWGWIDLGFNPELIAAAYEKAVTTKRTYNPAYVNGILKNWKAKGIETVAQLSEKDQPASVTIHRTESVPKPIDIVKLKRIVDEI